MQSKGKKVKNRVGIIVLRVFFVVLLIGIFVGVGAGLGSFMGIVKSAPDIKAFDVIPKGYTSIIYNQNGNEVTQLQSDTNRIYVELDQIPKYLQEAVIATEDERFYEHNGIDLKGILRAVFVNLKSGDLSEGASTITQQLIKNNVLSTEKTFTRKLQEQFLAIQLEKEMDKDLILEYYLNTMGLGHGTNGVQAAAKRYFNKDVWDLTLAESAVIAGITQRPTDLSPILHPENNKEKQHTILQKMLDQGYINEDQYNEALEEDVYSKIQQVSQEYEEESHNSYFVDEVINRVIQDLQTRKGMSETQAKNMVFRGGLSIYITQDSKMQEIMDNAFSNEDLFPPKDMDYQINVIYKLSVKHADDTEENFYKEQLVDTAEEVQPLIDAYKEEVLKSTDTIIAEKTDKIPQPQAAMVIMDYHNGYVKALTGGRGEKIASQTFDRATQAKRQPGSTFKILAAYAPALDTGGFTPATVIDDVPFSISIPGQAPYRPKNWYDHQTYNYRGLSTVREGIRDSMNLLAVKTLYSIGLDTAFDYLQHFGFTTLVDSEEKDGRVYTDKNYSLALGGLTYGVTPLELTAAYGAIANKGKYEGPIFYTKVLDHDGNILIDNQPEEHTVLKETTSFLLTDMMEDVVTSGTGTLARFQNVSMPVAGKTGTTTDNVDLLFAGYTPYYVGGIWMGHDKNKELVYDRSYHNILWRTIMEEIHKDLPYKEFERPEGIVTAKICTESGKLAVEGLCDEDPRGSTVRTEYFVKGTEPKEPCDVHVKEKICTESGLFANEYCPEDTVEEKVFIVRPEPLDESMFTGSNPPRIADRQYEIPPSMVGEYCNIHGPINSIFDSFLIPNKDKNSSNSHGNSNDVDRSINNSEDIVNSIDDFFFHQDR